MAREGEGARRPGREAARLLLESPLFDEEWYALRTGAAGDRAALVDHYLSTPVAERTSPHPLFDPEWFRAQLAQDLSGKDPFLVYLRRRAFGTATHPAFSTVHYRRTVDGAKEHPHGPLAHYVEVGAPAGVPGNRFLPAGPDGRALDLRAWLLARHRALAEGPPPAPGRTPSADVVSVLLPVPAVPGAWQAAWETVTPLVAEGAPQGRSLQVLVVDLGAAPDDAVKLDVLALRHADVEVVHPWSDRPTPELPGALAQVAPWLRGSTTVLLGHAVDVRPGWLAPLLSALEDDDDLRAAQPLVLSGDGTVASAGVVLTEGSGAQPFLAGLPVEDAAGVRSHRFPALAGACVALRSVDLRSADLAAAAGEGDRLVLAERPGRLAVVPEAVVVQRAPAALECVTTGVRLSAAAAGELWRSHGFEVADPALRRLRVEVSQAPPRLRWAIKNPAPAGPVGERWGDTHFASSLARALREVGQEVVVDRREAFDRASSVHDDVHLLLRGLTAWRPPAHGVSLAWVISHPEEVDEAEVRAYDRVLAASVTWAQERTQRWGVEVEPLLQATDARLFHPDRAAPDTGDRVLFVGSARGEYRPMVRAAVEQGVPLSLYGTGWEEIVPATVLRGQYVPNGEVAAAYRAAGVVLNDHWEDMRRDGFLSNRLFDAAASGARVLTDDVAGLGGLFGRSVQVVRTPEELARLTSLPDPDTVFGDDAERRAVAERIREEHSFTARARRLVEVAAEAFTRT